MLPFSLAGKQILSIFRFGKGAIWRSEYAEGQKVVSSLLLDRAGAQVQKLIEKGDKVLSDFLNGKHTFVLTGVQH